MTDQCCKACLVCGSTRIERRQRAVMDFVRMRAAKYQCHHCQGILYRKNRLAALINRWRNPPGSLSASS